MNTTRRHTLRWGRILLISSVVALLLPAESHFLNGLGMGYALGCWLGCWIIWRAIARIEQSKDTSA